MSVIGAAVFCTGIISKDSTSICHYRRKYIELISGLFFWIHNKSISQLNLYFERLSRSEKYLIAIQLVNRFYEDKQKAKGY